MKSVLIANVIIKSVFMVCVTAVTIYFKNAWILWWFICLPFLGYEYKETPIKKGGAEE